MPSRESLEDEGAHGPTTKGDQITIFNGERVVSCRVGVVFLKRLHSHQPKQQQPPKGRVAWPDLRFADEMRSRIGADVGSIFPDGVMI